MVVITPLQKAFVLVRPDGSYQRFASKEDALRIYGYSYFRERLDSGAGYALLDPSGRPLRAYEDLWPTYWSWARWGPWNGQGPVPGTGRRRGRQPLRRPQTLSARREAAAYLSEEGEPAARPCRRKLPTSWDDMCRADYGVRSWKAYRKTQHRPIRGGA